MKWTKKSKKHGSFKAYAASMFRTNSFHHGSYSVLLSCIVIALAIIVNLVVSVLPSSIINLDLSSSKILSISDQTKDIVENLEQDVTIYALYEGDNQDDTMMQLLDRYKELSDHIKVEVVDPVANPAFTANYDASSLSTGSLIVESEDRYKTIDYYDIYESSYYSDSSSYYGYSTTTEFDGEGEITSAIDYVTSADLPVLYYTTGHDEITLGDTTTSALAKSNYDMQSLSLMSEGSIPEDCGVLMILAPQADFSSDEADMVIDYLENGGKALILTSYTGETLTEFERILDNYGLGTSQGIVFEGDSSSYYQSPMYIIPQYESHDITADASDSNTLALIIQAASLEQKEVRSSVTQTPLLTTSEDAYEKVPENGQFATTEKESGDKEGSFNLGILAEETVSDEETTQLIVFSTPYLTEESFVSNYNISNVDIFLNSIGYMCEHETSISIDTKSMDVETVTPSAATVSMQSILFVVLLPAGLLIAGIVVWLRRRKK